jgi:hypothetical protein
MHVSKEKNTVNIIEILTSPEILMHELPIGKALNIIRNSGVLSSIPVM